MSKYIKLSEIKDYINKELEHHRNERDQAELNGYDEKRVNAAVMQIMCDLYAQKILDNVKHYEFDDKDCIKQ